MVMMGGLDFCFVIINYDEGLKSPYVYCYLLLLVRSRQMVIIWVLLGMVGTRMVGMIGMARAS